MRWIAVLIGVFTYLYSPAQTKHVIIGDTAQLCVWIDPYDDTSYSIKKLTSATEWIIYFDSTKSKIAEHLIRGHRFFIDTVWYSTGALQSISQKTTSDCFECSNDTSWYIDGILKSTYKCNTDTCVHAEFYHSGQLREKNITWSDSSLPSGSFAWHYKAQYYENGQLIYTIGDPSKKEDQYRCKYYPSGQKLWESTLRFDCRIGPYKEWHSNGVLKIQGEYSDKHVTTWAKPEKKIGTWSYYNESGKLIKEEFYEEGKLVKTVEY